MAIEMRSYSTYRDTDLSVTRAGIDPQEIESVLAQHEQVKAVVVLPRKDPSGDQRLVAYIVPESEQVGLVRKLRTHLSSCLPPHITSLAFVLLDTSLLSNGAIDLQALPSIELARAQLSTAYREPQTVVEKQVAGLLGQVLEVNSIGRNDDFFELGGNSILAVKFTVRIMETFGVRILPRRFYEGPTVAELALVIESLLEDRPQLERGE